MDFCQKLVLLLLIVSLVLLPSSGSSLSPVQTLVNPTLISIDDGALCLSGKPAAYYFVQGHGEGIANWLVYLPGGGWCQNVTNCQDYIGLKYLYKDHSPSAFQYILSNNQDENPEFFNWNKVSISYCDGSSFTGNSEIVNNGTKYYFRGARIFKAAIQEMLAKGMGNAQNALLVGSSAGGVAATIYCDRFRGFFHSASRVKCFSDGGYFFLSKHHIQGNKFLSMFEGLIKLHKSKDALPKFCTSKLPAALINYTLSEAHAICAANDNCSFSQMKMLQDLRLDFIDVLPKEEKNSSKGVLITSPFAHTRVLDASWNYLVSGTKQTYNELFRDWYFDRKNVHIIDPYTCPYHCHSN